jgi:hypothetical protein
MLNSNTTTTVSMAQMEWVAMSLGSRRNTRSVVNASAVATFAANTGLRGSLRANAHISAAAARAASRSRSPNPFASVACPHTSSRPAAAPVRRAGTPQSNESGISGSRTPRRSCADRSEPSSGRLDGGDPIAPRGDRGLSLPAFVPSLRTRRAVCVRSAPPVLSEANRDPRSFRSRVGFRVRFPPPYPSRSPWLSKSC